VWDCNALRQPVPIYTLKHTTCSYLNFFCLVAALMLLQLPALKASRTAALTGSCWPAWLNKTPGEHRAQERHVQRHQRGLSRLFMSCTTCNATDLHLLEGQAHVYSRLVSQWVPVILSYPLALNAPRRHSFSVHTQHTCPPPAVAPTCKQASAKSLRCLAVQCNRSCSLGL
jgi:hypothetical protein